jgi:hypothetical protein
MNGIAIFGDQSQQARDLFATHNAVCFPPFSGNQRGGTMLTSAVTQVGMMVGVIALLFYVATRQPQNRRAIRRSSGDSLGAADTGYDDSDSGHHHGASGDHSGSGHSGSASDSSGGDSSGGGDAGGGDGVGGDGGGGGSD